MFEPILDQYQPSRITPKEEELFFSNYNINHIQDNSDISTVENIFEPMEL